jgi:N-acetylglucosamine kinase-like BadF-type ATPase
MAMRLIADCGSTSCKWINDINSCLLTGPGINPTVMKEEDFRHRISLNENLWKAGEREAVSQVDFFGAGCTLPSAVTRMKEALQKCFPHALIRVESDLMAACLAGYAGKPTAVGILGTGSAVAGFDGRNMIRSTPSLGYVLGDEGAGSTIGRRMLTAYLYGELPQDLHQQFEKLFPETTVDSVLSTFYGPQASGGMLAAYAGLAVVNKNHSYIIQILTPLFEDFISRHLMPLRNAGYEKVAIIGSVGYGFSELLRSLLQKAGFTEILFFKDPMERLPAIIWNQKGHYINAQRKTD